LHWKLFCHEEIKLQKLSVSIEMQDIFIIFLYSFSAVSIYLRIFLYFILRFFHLSHLFCMPIFHFNFFFCCWIIQFLFHSTIDSFCHRIVKNLLKFFSFTFYVVLFWTFDGKLWRGMTLLHFWCVIVYWFWTFVWSLGVKDIWRQFGLK